VLFLWDKPAAKIGFQPVLAADKRAYDLSYAEKDHTAYTSARRFLQWINYDYSVTRVFEVNWDDKTGIVEVHIPKEYMDKDKRPKNKTASQGGDL